MTQPMRVCVAVITYQRPELLRALIRSLNRQQVGSEINTELVVVDNDPQGSAAEVVFAEAQWPTQYHVEPEPGIPFARQRSVDLVLAGDADALVFVDDDEECPPDWLATLVACHRSTGAPVVTGPVAGRIPPEAPEWNHHSDVHTSVGKHATGNTLDKAYTNNTLVLRAVLTDVTPAFDPRFRFTGSSDLHFFLRVARAGHRIVWCNEAAVWENVPLERTKLGWLARRAFRSGAGDTVSRRLIQPGVRTWLGCGLLGVARLGSGSILMAAGLLGRPDRRIKGFRRACSAMGSFAGLFGINHQEYRR